MSKDALNERLEKLERRQDIAEIVLAVVGSVVFIMLGSIIFSSIF